MNAIHGGISKRGDVRLERLSRYDCWQLVSAQAARDAIARVVWTGPDGMAIVPMNYTVADGFLWFQTTPTSRLALEGCDHEVLVEVDHIDTATHTGWSVVVSGVAKAMSTSDDPGILGNLAVWPRGPHEILLRVAPDEITGRRLRRHD